MRAFVFFDVENVTFFYFYYSTSHKSMADRQQRNKEVKIISVLLIQSATVMGLENQKAK